MFLKGQLVSIGGRVFKIKDADDGKVGLDATEKEDILHIRSFIPSDERATSYRNEFPDGVPFAVIFSKAFDKLTLVSMNNKEASLYCLQQNRGQ